MTHQVDRFYAAVSVLAGDGHIKQRLMRAYQDNLDDIIEDELPAKAKRSFVRLRKLMHRVSPLNGEGPICASVRKMSVNEASECAASVVSLYGDILLSADDIREQLPGNEDEAEIVPAFLVKSVS